MDAKLQASRERPHDSAGGEGIRRHRMRFSVRVRAQNASFRRVRFFSPAQTWRPLTEKRILLPPPHGKAHSAAYASRKGALCDPQIAQNALFRHVAAPGRCGATPPPACGAGCTSVRRSRFELDLTERRTLPNRWASDCAFPSRRDRRMRLSVRVHAQNALFLTWANVAPPHGKAHSATCVSRKSAFCKRDVTKKRTLRHPSRGAITQGAPFREERRHSRGTLGACRLLERTK